MLSSSSYSYVELALRAAVGNRCLNHAQKPAIFMGLLIFIMMILHPKDYASYYS